MKTISLSKGKVAVVDDDDYERLIQFKWYALNPPKKQSWYAVRSKTDNGKQVSILMHREILKAPSTSLVDHRDGDGLNNQKENLRLCSSSQNAQNRRRAYVSSTSRFKGVSFGQHGITGIEIGFCGLVRSRSIGNTEMIKYYCDWCRNETVHPHGGTFGRRVGLSLSNHPTGKMNVCFSFEFSEPKPSHLCRSCYVEKIREALSRIAVEDAKNHPSRVSQPAPETPRE